MNPIRPLLYVGMLLAVACSGDGPGQSGNSATVGASPNAEGQAKLWLTSTTVGNAVTLSVNYEPGATPAPRVADIRISHSETLELDRSAVGEGARASGKELTTQQPQSGMVRLILLSKDTKRMVGGELARLTFRRTENTAAKFDLMTDSPIFAPAESMRGLVIGDPLQL